MTPRRSSAARVPAKDRALGLLAVRWRSREELRRRLRQAGYDRTEIDPAIQDLERAGLLDDERFAAEVVRDRASRRLGSDRSIRSALREKGVEPEIVERALQGAGDEETRARRLASTRVGRLSGADPADAYRRLYSLLARRGYPPELARHASLAAVHQAFPSDDDSDAGLS